MAVLHDICKCQVGIANVVQQSLDVLFCTEHMCLTRAPSNVLHYNKIIRLIHYLES